MNGEKETSAKERVKSKLTNAMASDIKESKVKQRIQSLEKVDGKITATFSITGLPHKDDNYSDSYRDIPKIFDTWDNFSSYAEAFFNASDEELIKLAEAETKK